jgi:hypothetical protein
MNALAAIRRALEEYPGRNPQQLQAHKVCEGVLKLAATLTQQQPPHPEALPDGTLSKSTHKRLSKQQGGEPTLAETQRAIIEAAERRGYERGLADAAGRVGHEGGEQEARAFLAAAYRAANMPTMADVFLSKPWEEFRTDDACALDAVLAALRSKPAASEGNVVPDPVLCQFYQVETVEQLLTAQEEHILKLQETVRHNVKPWEDTFPPTLLPKYLRESGLANTSKQAAGEAVSKCCGYANPETGRCYTCGGQAIDCMTTPPRHPADEGMDSARLDYIERTFSGMTNRERYLPVQMIWGKGCNGRTLREACDKYMAKEAALQAGTP